LLAKQKDALDSKASDHVYVDGRTADAIEKKRNLAKVKVVRSNLIACPMGPFRTSHGFERRFCGVQPF
jgi:hypothetical protein